MSSGGKGGGGGGTPTEGTFLVNPITYWRERVGTYPGNNHTWWAYKRPLEVGSDTPGRYYLEVFDPGMRHQITVTNTQAPIGHYLYNAFFIDRSAASGIPNLAVESSGPARPRCVAFFAGRVFYAGVKSTKYSSRIYFSQIIERDVQVAYCYQQQDPTQEDAPDLLPSDGGVIVAPDIAEIIALFPKGANLYVLATNGVWRISGSEGIGFRANDHSITKLDDAGALNHLSLVSVNGNPVWWNRSGIYTIVEENALTANVTSLTDSTIKTFYNDIPEESKYWAKGAYNHQTKIIQWLYASEAPSGPEDYNVYDRILNFNTLTGAFYPWSVPADQVRLKGIIAVEGDTTVTETVPVMHGEDQVMVGDEEVITNVHRREFVDSKFKYLVDAGEDVSELP